MTETYSDRVHSSDLAWPSRPWWMALIGAVGGVAFQYFADADGGGDPGNIGLFAATFIAIAVASFVLTLEPRRWLWSLLFAVGWGSVIGLIAVTTQGYNRIGTIFELPFFSGMLAVLIAAPLFQAARDAGTGWRVLRIPPQVAHTHAWTDAVIGAVALAFVGVTFAMAWLIAGLFDMIGIHILSDLLKKIWFGFGLAGFAAGAAIGLLRERDALVATMQRLVMIVLAVLAPVLAAALLLFLVSLLGTGLTGLWDGDLSAAALMLSAAGGAWLLINAAIGHGDEPKPPHRVLLWGALILSLVVLPLAILALSAMLLRVGQYGWTPQRIWGVIAAGVALAYGLAGWWSVGRGRMPAYADQVRAAQVPLALGVCLLASILSLPLVDFGAISARDQLARLSSGRVTADKFDWRAMAFDFGPSGRAALQRVARTGPVGQREAALRALSAENRYDVQMVTAGATADVRPLAERLRIVPAGRTFPPEAMAVLSASPSCATGRCAVLAVDANRWAVLNQADNSEAYPSVDMMIRDAGGRWSFGDRLAREGAGETRNSLDLSTTEIRVGTRRQREIIVNGRSVRDIAENPVP
jgi:hypothetical protein